ncbi:hypothetical protein J5N97_027778 [Dioscorea zingiberensis]|uniref:Uncharacterized protein n=1 Tax=Dioscorea zingiberensis TaxID=325984 RepID=A0A9D5H4A7_9LILI|nr:hypothetical protein J5N97_027778 [Dioscorea zingiberensis]
MCVKEFCFGICFGKIETEPDSRRGFNSLSFRRNSSKKSSGKQAPQEQEGLVNIGEKKEVNSVKEKTSGKQEAQEQHDQVDNGEKKEVYSVKEDLVSKEKEEKTSDQVEEHANKRPKLVQMESIAKRSLAFDRETLMQEPPQETSKGDDFEDIPHAP